MTPDISPSMNTSCNCIMRLFRVALAMAVVSMPHAQSFSHQTPPIDTKASASPTEEEDRVEIWAWSGGRGWGLEVHACLFSSTHRCEHGRPLVIQGEPLRNQEALWHPVANLHQAITPRRSLSTSRLSQSFDHSPSSHATNKINTRRLSPQRTILMKPKNIQALSPIMPTSVSSQSSRQSSSDSTSSLKPRNSSPPSISDTRPGVPWSSSPSPATTANHKHKEGITLSVLNQRNARLILQKVFPLGMYWAYWADLEWHMEHVAPGRVVVMTVSMFGTIGLRHARQCLTQLGSLFAQHLTPSAHWTWVFVKGGRTIAETVVLRGNAPHFAHTILPLFTMPIPPTLSSTLNTTLEMQRWAYCGREGGMGGLCDEEKPDPLPPPSPPILKNQHALDGVPVVVTAGNRHQYLYYTLKHLLAAPGAQLHNLLVVLGDAPQSTTQLLHLLNVNFTTIAVQGHGNTKLFRYYRSVFSLIARTFPKAPAVILLDEDVQVSPDFFSFFSQTLWLLRTDPTLYCINGYGGSLGLSHDVTRVLRGDAQVSWGYAITLEFVREALLRWRKDAPGQAYDYWLYMVVAAKRECVFPSVSRTRHFGVGVNTLSWIKEKHFLTNPLVESAHIKLQDVSSLQLPLWRRQLSRSIQNAVPLQDNPCSPRFLPKPLHTTTYVFFVNMTRQTDGSPDISDYFHVAHCLGAWSLSPMGLHEGVATFTPSAHATLHVVGVPYSPYAYLHPPEIPVWTMTNITKSERQIVDECFSAKRKMFVPNVNTTEETVLNALSSASFIVKQLQDLSIKW